MVRKILSVLTREIRGLHEAAYVLAGFSMLSQVLALLRDRTFANLFGAGQVLDAYFAAFRVPDILFAFLTLFVSSFALVPMLAAREKEDQGALIGNILFAFGFISILASALLWFLMPTIVPLLIPGFSDTAITDTILLSRIMLLQPLLLGISSIASSLVQVMRRFILYALAPIFYNVGIIFGALVLYPLYGVSGLAWGVVFGAVLHALAQGIPLLGHAKHVKLPTIASLRASIIDVALSSMPRALALSSQQILLLVFTGIASIAGVGAVAALSFATNLQSVPLTIIGISYAAALFPLLSSLIASGDRTGFAREVWASVRHVIFWTFPAITIMIVLRAHIVRVILGSGNFTWSDTRLTAALVALFVISLISQSLILIFSRAYYAAGKTLVPIVLNVGGALVASVGAYIGLLWLTDATASRYFIESLLRVSDIPGVPSLMIPFAYSLSLIAVSIIFAVLFARTYGYEVGVLDTLVHSSSASIIGASASYAVLQALGPLLPTETFMGIFIQGASAGIIGLLVWALMLHLLGSGELKEIRTVLRDKLSNYRIRFGKSETPLS